MDCRWRGGNLTLTTSSCHFRDYSGEFLQYPVVPGRGVDSRQTGSIQEAAVMQSDADEVGGAVGGCTYKQATVGNKVVNLEQETPADQQQLGPSEEVIR